VIVFTAEQEVDQQDSDSGASDDHDAVAEKEKAEHVVDFAEPHVIHDEVELDEDSTEREGADQKHGRERAEVGR